MGKLCQKDKFYFTVYKELNYSTLYFAQQRLYPIPKKSGPGTAKPLNEII